MTLPVYETETHSPAETARLGETLGRMTSPGTIIGLTGDLGSGKTAFTQGLARGIGVEERYYVTSPSYTLINQYPGKRLTLYHIDLYRINDRDELTELGLEELFSQKGVVAIEWAEKFGRCLWQEDLEIELTAIGVLKRLIRLTPHNQEAATLIEKLIREQPPRRAGGTQQKIS